MWSIEEKRINIIITTAKLISVWNCNHYTNAKAIIIFFGAGERNQGYVLLMIMMTERPSLQSHNHYTTAKIA